MAYLALFVALGGSSYAAIKVTGKNVKDASLTGKDVKNSSLTSADVKNSSLLKSDFKPGQLPAGDQGPQGATGPQGPAGTNGGDGAPGADGAPGPPRFVDVKWARGVTGTPPNQQSGCTAAAEWRECAPVTVTVPAGKTYKISVNSAGSYFAYGVANRVRSCVSVRPQSEQFQTTAAKPSSCPEVNYVGTQGITLADGQVGNLATTARATLTGGASGTTYVVGSAVRPDTALHYYNGFDVTRVDTVVDIADVTP